MEVGAEVERGEAIHCGVHEGYFGGAGTVLQPSVGGEDVERVFGPRGAGLVDGAELFEKADEAVGGFAGREEGAGIEIVFAAVAGRAALADLGLRSAGFGAVQAGGGFLAFGDYHPGCIVDHRVSEFFRGWP